jgi:hypothetical protein
MARGLGEQVTVVGLSGSAVIVAWLAQFRADVDKAIVIAPVFGLLPNWPIFGTRSNHAVAGLLDLLHFLFPGTGLPLDQVHSHFDSLRLSGVHHPYDLAACFRVADLHCNHVSRLQLSFQTGDLGPVMTDVASLGAVDEWTTVRSHTKHSDRQLYVQPGLWFF